jgi:hypothetical protein
MKLEAKIMRQWPTLKSGTPDTRKDFAKKVNEQIVKAPFKVDPLKAVNSVLWGFIKENL